MKIAVTGAGGFIGRHVIAKLQAEKVQIVAVTRDARSLQDMCSSIDVVEMDISCPATNVFKHLGCPDVLIHLAWDGLPNYKSPHHFETELPSQYRFLKAMIASGLQSLLVTGTCFEYGMQSGCLSENMLVQPANPYGYAKNALFQQLLYLQSTQNFKLSWARLFYLYGEGQAATSLYSLLKDAALRGDKAFNMSGGEQLRDYLPVNVAAKLLVQLAMKKSDLGVVNICSGKPISVRNLVEDLLRERDWDISLNLGYYPYPEYEPFAFWGDNTYLKKLVDS